jgi:hypothetical protein
MGERSLVPFSIAFSIVAIAMIVVPYLRRKRDLVSARTFFWAGALIYVGLSGINSIRLPHYFQYSSKTYSIYYLCIIVYFVAFEWAYNRMKLPQRWGASHFQVLPSTDGVSLWFPMLLALLATLGQLALIQIPGIAVLVIRMGTLAPIFALAFAMAIWRRGKYNPISIALVLGIFLVEAYLAFSKGGGRRPLYSLAATPVICLYWWYFRYWKPTLTLALLSCLLVLAPIADSAYRAVRWQASFGSEAKRESASVGSRWQVFKNSLFSRSESFGESALQIGHNSVENMLLGTYVYTEARGQFPLFSVKPLHSLYVIATLPIPRALWEDKPRQIGLTMPFDAGLLNKNVKTNWGPGIVTHGFHDGGILALLLYAVLAGGFIRYFDELLVRHPGNPYLMGFLGGASVQIVGFIRGDIATMIPLTMLAFVVFMGLAWVSRFFVGSERPWARWQFTPFARRAGTPA